MVPTRRTHLLHSWLLSVIHISSVSTTVRHAQLPLNQRLPALPVSHRAAVVSSPLAGSRRDLRVHDNRWRITARPRASSLPTCLRQPQPSPSLTSRPPCPFSPHRPDLVPASSVWSMQVAAGSERPLLWCAELRGCTEPPPGMRRAGTLQSFAAMSPASVAYSVGFSGDHKKKTGFSVDPERLWVARPTRFPFLSIFNFF